MAKLGNLEVGIIIDEGAFTAKMQKIKSILVNAEQQINKITRAGPKEDLSAAKMQVDLEKSKVALSTAQLRLEEQKKKIAAGPSQKAEQDNRRALQQQYYQTASLSRLAFMIGGMTTAISLFGRTAVMAYVGWEQKMADARAAAQATNREFEDMVTLSLSMGRTTIFSAIEAANGMEILAKAGYKAADVIKALDGALLLAGATGESFETGTALIVAVLSQFEMGAEKSTEAANILAGGAQFSLASIQSLGQGLKFVGPTLHMFGQGLDEGVTALAELQNAGIRAQMGGRLLATALMRLNSNSAAVQKGLSELGLTFSQVAPASNSLSTIIGNLEEAQKNLGNTQKFSAAMMQLFGTESVRVMIPLVALGKEGFDKLQSRINEAGTAEAMMLVRTDTLSFALKKLANVTQNIYIEMGKASAEGGVKGFVLGLTELLRKLEQTSPAFKSAIANMGGFSVAAGIGITSVFGLIAGLATMRLAMVELKAASKASSLAFLSFLGQPLPFMGLLAGVSLLSLGVVKAIQSMRNETDEAKTSFARARLELMQTESNWETAIAQWRLAKETLKGTKEGTKENNDAMIGYRRAILSLIQLSPEYLGTLDEEKIGLDQITEAYKKQREEKEKTQEAERERTIKALRESIGELELEVAGMGMTTGQKFMKGFIKGVAGATKEAAVTFGEFISGKVILPGGAVVQRTREISEEEQKRLLEDIKKRREELKRMEEEKEARRIGLPAGPTSTEPPGPPPKPTPEEIATQVEAEKRRAERIIAIRAELNREMQRLTLDQYAFDEEEARREFEKTRDDVQANAKNKMEEFALIFEAAKLYQLKINAVNKARSDKAALDAQKEADLKTQAEEKYRSIQDALTLMGLQGKTKELEELRQKEEDWNRQVDQWRGDDVSKTEQAEQLKALIKQTYAAKTMEVEKTLYGAEAKMVEQLVSEFEDLVQITDDWKLQMKSVSDIFRDMMNWFLRSFLKAGFLSLLTGNPLIGIGGTLATVFGGTSKMAVPNPAPMEALTRGPLPVLTAAAKRSITFHYEQHFEGTFLEPEAWIKKTLVPAQRRVAKQKLTGEGE
jgi:TP901 family phage tail tape measure protein